MRISWQLVVNVLMLVIVMTSAVCLLKAILKGDEEVRAWLDYDSVPLDDVSTVV